MNKLGLAVISALAATSAARADVILDTFTSSQGTVVSVAAPAPQTTTVGNRTIAITTTTPSPLANPFLSVTATSGPVFSIANPSQTTSTVVLSYTLGVLSGFTGLSGGGLKFDVLNNDQGNSGTVTISAMFTGTGANAGNNFSLAATPIPGAPPAGSLFLALSASQLAAVTGGGTLSFSFNGPVDYDLTLDNLTLVPEPASVALLGAGLMGLGLARRRKRA
jgi:hypothetical protein